MKRTLVACWRSETPQIRPVLATLPPYVIALAAAFWVYLLQYPTPAVLALTACAFLLGLLTLVDLKYGTLPHLLTGLLLACGLVLAPLVLGVAPVSSMAAAILGMAMIFGCALLAEKLAGQQALGGGDLWLTAAIGAWIGLAGLPMFVLALAALGLVSVAVARGAGGGRRFPFGPALAGAGWLALLYQSAYWHAITGMLPS